MSVYISLCTVSIPANYTSEFRELLETTAYLILKACEDPHLFWLSNWTGKLGWELFILNLHVA